MADIDLVTADKVSLVRGHIGDGHLAPPGVAGEAITAGAPVFRDGTTGRYMNSDANDATREAVMGIALRTVISGEPVSVAMGRAMLDGYDLSGLDFGDTVYVSDTVGALADAAGSTTLAVGTVVPGFAVPAGTDPDKLLELAL